MFGHLGTDIQCYDEDGNEIDRIISVESGPEITGNPTVKLIFRKKSDRSEVASIILPIVVLGEAMDEAQS